MISVPEPVLQHLASSFGTQAINLKYFGGGQAFSDGIVYAFPFKERRRLLKIMAFPNADQDVSLFYLEERLKFVHFLGEQGAQIVFPELSPQGNLVELIPCDQHVWIGYVMELAPGKPVPEKVWDPGIFRNWGQTIGQLHRLAQQYPSWRSSQDPSTGKELLTWREEWHTFHDWIKDNEVKSKWVELKCELDALPEQRDSFGFIHNDPHIWNLRADGDHITLLDFDVANHHWFINDIAIACQNNLIFLSGGMNGPVHHLERLIRFLEYFMEGYTRENRLAQEWLARLDLFIAYRRILLFTVMNDWVRSKPALGASWKRMILSQPDIIGTSLIGNSRFD